MSFASYVSRVYGKRPVWLYRVVVGGTAYHYTSKGGGYTTPSNSPNADFPSGQVWTSAPIQRGEIYLTVKANRNDTWLRLPTANALSAAVIANDDVNEITVEIWQGYIGDPDNEFQMMFTGRVVEVEPALIATTLICETTISQSRRSSVAQVVQRPCRHAHYFTNADGGGCRLNLGDWQETLAATVSTGRSVTVPDAALVSDGYYLAGILEYGGVEYMIESHIGQVLVLEKEAAGLAAAIAANNPAQEDVILAPGCNLTITNCDAFNNVENFGGFNDMTDSPFDGRSIA